MARSVDSDKRNVWRERLRRFERSRLTVEAFCRSEDVSVASFYHWRRMLAPVAARFTSTTPATRRGEPVAIARQAFVPVEVVATTTIDIHLSNGARVAVPADNLTALQAAITAVARLPRASREVEAC